MGVSVGRFVPRKPFQHEQAGRDVLEELRRAVIKRIDQVVKVDAAMVLLKDGLGGAIQDLPLMGNVFAKGTEFRQTLLDICSAELLEYFASLSPDFFRSNCFDEALDDPGW